MNFKNIFSLISPYKTLVVVGTATLLMYSVMGLLLPLTMKFVIDDILPHRDMDMLFILLGSLVILYALRQIFFYIAYYITYYVSQRVLFDIRRRMVTHVQSLSLSFFNRFRTGKLIANLINDVAKLQAMINQGITNLILQTFCIVSILGVLCIMDWKLFLLCLVFMPLYACNFSYFKGSLHSQSKALQEKVSEMSASLSEVLSGVKVVKSFGNEKNENKRFVKYFTSVFDMQMGIQRGSIVCTIIAESIGALSCIIIIGAGAYRVWSGQMSIGSFVSFYAYLGMIFGPIQVLCNMAPTFAEGCAGMSRINSILSEKPEIEDGHLEASHEDINQKIRFEKVNFAYQDKSIIKELNLDIEPGQTVALVGPSGSGKSTIASLMLRFYDVSSGRITIGGRDIRDFQMGSFRSHVGVVLQEPFLFSGSIAENIAYGMADASFADIERAAKMANAHEFIMDLDDGYQSEVGERGVMLSGGQKQRIAIARTLLRDPAILILDEATSALDNQSEWEVQQALDKLMGTRTTLVIAHRLSTIRNADTIVVMEAGEISQMGAHHTLMECGGLYRELYLQSQRDGKQEEPVCVAACEDNNEEFADFARKIA